MATKETQRKGFRINNSTREVEGRNGHRLTQKDTIRISNWKTLGHDGIHGFWFKKFNTIHSRVAQEMKRCLEEAQVPD